MPPPYKCGFSIYGPVPPYGGFTLQDVANRAALLRGNLIRVHISWSALQTDPTTWSYTELDQVRALAATARYYNPAMKLLPIFGGVPAWVASRSANGHYVQTQADYDKYGYAASQALSYLGDYADFIELSNEPNTTIASNGSATEIPSNHYGGMAAYATFWIDACLGPNKHPLVGALATGQAASYLDGTWQNYLTNVRGATGFWLYMLYPTNQYPGKAAALHASWRISIHPYPHLGSGFQPASPSNPSPDHTAEDASATVFEIVNAATALAEGRRIWITETGVSEWKIGAGTTNGQARFVDLVHFGVLWRQPQLEGCIWWPLNDAGPQVSDVNSAFHRMGVVWPDNNSYKPGANRMVANWA
jgi:hypothetical protein